MTLQIYFLISSTQLPRATRQSPNNVPRKTLGKLSRPIRENPALHLTSEKVSAQLATEKIKVIRRDPSGSARSLAICLRGSRACAQAAVRSNRYGADFLPTTRGMMVWIIRRRRGSCSVFPRFFRSLVTARGKYTIAGKV